MENKPHAQQLEHLRALCAEVQHLLGDLPESRFLERRGLEKQLVDLEREILQTERHHADAIASLADLYDQLRDPKPVEARNVAQRALLLVDLMHRLRDLGRLNASPDAELWRLLQRNVQILNLHWIGSRFRHWKGSFYFVACVSVEADSGTIFVSYGKDHPADLQDLPGEEMIAAARTLVNFLEPVDAQGTPRFRRWCDCEICRPGHAGTITMTLIQRHVREHRESGIPCERASGRPCEACRNEEPSPPTER